MVLELGAEVSAEEEAMEVITGVMEARTGETEGKETTEEIQRLPREVREVE